ncbi:glycosyl transferase family 21-domain-containing protein [Blastocladiella britannica]|nr:glycosyl transferase family 21-domain-containing protein [Blastocladiella britannica]
MLHTVILPTLALVWWLFSAVVIFAGVMTSFFRMRRRGDPPPPAPNSSAAGIGSHVPFWAHNDGAMPGVTVLRPLKGVDVNIEANLASSFEQNYPKDRLELVFCVADPDDPVIPIVKNLMARFSDVTAKLVIGDMNVGVNPKINNLVRGYAIAAHDVVWIADSNVWSGPSTLRSSVSSLAKPGIGLVHHLPCGLWPMSRGSELEWLFLNAFHARAYLGINWLGPSSCVVGKSTVFRRSDLALKGGLAEFGKYMAEDNMIGQAIWDLGLRHVITPDRAWQPLGAMTVRDFFARRMRWGRIRKYTVVLATVAEPFTECVTMSAIFAFAVRAWWPVVARSAAALLAVLTPGPASASSLAAIDLIMSTPPPAFWAVYVAHVVMWFTFDYVVARNVAGSCLPLGTFVKAWAAREAMALPAYVWAVSGSTLDWRGALYQILPGGTVRRVEKEPGAAISIRGSSPVSEEAESGLLSSPTKRNGKREAVVLLSAQIRAADAVATPASLGLRDPTLFTPKPSLASTLSGRASILQQKQQQSGTAVTTRPPKLGLRPTTRVLDDEIPPLQLPPSPALRASTPPGPYVSSFASHLVPQQQQPPLPPSPPSSGPDDDMVPVSPGLGPLTLSSIMSAIGSSMSSSVSRTGSTATSGSAASGAGPRRASRSSGSAVYLHPPGSQRRASLSQQSSSSGSGNGTLGVSTVTAAPASSSSGSKPAVILLPATPTTAAEADEYVARARTRDARRKSARIAAAVAEPIATVSAPASHVSSSSSSTGAIQPPSKSSTTATSRARRRVAPNTPAATAGTTYEANVLVLPVAELRDAHSSTLSSAPSSMLVDSKSEVTWPSVAAVASWPWTVPGSLAASAAATVHGGNMDPVLVRSRTSSVSAVGGGSKAGI